MNIIRTISIELSLAPAIAYRQKLKTGGAGIKIISLETGASAAYTVDKRTGDAVPYGAAANSKFFVAELVQEALDMTLGLPFAKRGAITAVGKVAGQTQEVEAEVVCEADLCTAAESDDPEKIDMYDTPEYRAIILEYSEPNGRLNYQRLNKDAIQFASRSKGVAKMLLEKAANRDIIAFVVKNRVAQLAGKKDMLSDCEVKALISIIDDMDPRSAFKDLSAHLKRMAMR